MPRTMASDMMDRKKEMEKLFKVHWACAVNAVNYVSSKMTTGADDKLDNVYYQLLVEQRWARSCVNEMRDDVEKEVLLKQKEEMKKPGADRTRIGAGGDVYWRIRIETEARRAAQTGCGNCGEQASMAFVYLRDMCKISPLDYLSYLDGDHSFVAIGRIEESIESSPSTWGHSTVICDPWGEGVYTLDQFMTRYPGRFDSEFRYQREE